MRGGKRGWSEVKESYPLTLETTDGRVNGPPHWRDAGTVMILFEVERVGKHVFSPPFRGGPVLRRLTRVWGRRLTMKEK